MQEKRNKKISEDHIDAIVIKEKSDWRNYSSKALHNGVKCMFAQDKESKITAMSACVKAGASSDPRERSGLSHFCDNMCFLGSDKCPCENEVSIVLRYWCKRTSFYFVEHRTFTHPNILL